MVTFFCAIAMINKWYSGNPIKTSLNWKKSMSHLKKRCVLNWQFGDNILLVQLCIKYNVVSGTALRISYQNIKYCVISCEPKTKYRSGVLRKVFGEKAMKKSSNLWKWMKYSKLVSQEEEKNLSEHLSDLFSEVPLFCIIFSDSGVIMVLASNHLALFVATCLPKSHEQSFEWRNLLPMGENTY